jgi:hypothetical protein
MAYASARRDRDRQPRPWRTTALQSAALAVVLLAATVVAAQAGGLLERLFTGKGAQRTEAPGASAGATLATVHLTVEGMVCYG